MILGSGSNATAYAQIDTNPADATYGQVTNIVVTNPGMGYNASNTVVEFIEPGLSGQGGPTYGALAGTALLGTNLDGGLIKNGYGALTLAATNNYSGATLVNAGSLVLAFTNNLGGALGSLGTNTLTLAGNAVSIGTTNVLSQSFLDWLNGRISSNFGGAVVLSVNSSSNLAFTGSRLTNAYLGSASLSPVVFSGAVTNWGDAGGDVRLGGGSGWLVYQPTIGGTTNVFIGPVGGDPLSTVQLSGTNTFTAPIWVQSGFLAVSNDINLGSIGNVVNLANGAGIRVTNTYAWAGTRQIVINGGGSIDVDSGSLLLMSNVINGAASGATLAKVGPGTLYLQNNNNIVGYNGGTFISNGTISIDSERELGTNSAVNVLGGVLQIRGLTMVASNLNNLAINWSNFNGGLDINNNAMVLNLTNNLAGNGNLIKTGNGLLVLSGNNTAQNMITVAGGALQISNGLALAGGGTWVQTNGQLQLAGNIITAAEPIYLFGSGMFGNNDGALRNVSGANTNAGSITLLGAARVNADTNTLLVQSGNITNAGYALTIGGFGNTFVSGVISGLGGLTKDGYGTLTLSNTNGFTGGVTLNSGLLALDYTLAGSPVGNIITNANWLALNGGEFLIRGQNTAGVTTQTFAYLAEGAPAGGTGIDSPQLVVSNGTSGSIVVNVGAITRSIGNGVVDVGLPQNGSIITTTTNNNAGLLAVGNVLVTITNTDFAMVTNINGSLVVAKFNGYTNVAGGNLIANNTNSVLGLWQGAGGNITIDTQTTAIYAIAATNTDQMATINVTGGTNALNTLRLGTNGAILLAPVSRGLTIGASVNDGFLTAGSTNAAAGEIVLINNSANNLVINSSINSNGIGAVVVTVDGSGVVNINGTNFFNGLYVNSGTVSVSNTTILAGASPLTVRGGTLIVSGANNNFGGGNMVVDAGQLIISNTITTGNNLFIGNAIGDRGVVLVSSNFLGGANSQLDLGFVAGSAGAVYQTAGIVTNGGLSDLSLNVGTMGYGYYRMSGGALASGRVELGEGLGGNGVFDMFGGTATGSIYTILGAASGSGDKVMNILGGIYSQTAANQFVFNFYGGGGLTVLNVGGSGTVSALGTINMNQGGSMTNYSVINLLPGGVLTVGGITASSPQGAGNALLNFNGGLLQASAASAGFITNIAPAFVYTGGAIIDSSNFSISAMVPLVAPAGYGVTNIAIANGGVGYIGAPIVQINGGSGMGATAIAIVDLTTGDSRYGQVTNIVITSYGSGYQSNDALSINLVGGGALQAAQLGTFSFGTNSAAGGLVKLGAGMLTLAGNNTYGGSTIISNGTLQVGINGNSGTLGVGGVLDYGTLIFSRGDTVYTNSAPIDGTGAVINNGTGMVTLAGLNTYSGGTWISNGVLQFNSPNSIPTSGGLIAIATNGVAALNFAGIQNTLNTYFDPNNTFGTIALTTNSANDSVIDLSTVPSTNFFLGALGVVNFTGSLVANGNSIYQLGGGGGVLTITSVLTDGGLNQNGVVIGGASPVGVVWLQGTNTYGGGTFINGGVLRADEGVGLSPFGNLVINGGVLEISTNFVRPLGNISGADVVQVIGGGGFSSYGGTGAVVNIGGGGILSWGSANFNPTNLILNAATASTNLTFANGLNLGANNRTVSVYSLTAPVTISGNITNGSFSKSGPGTLVLTGNNGNGATYIDGGTLQIGVNNTLLTNSMIAFGDVTNNPNGGGTLDLSLFNQTVGTLSVQTTNSLVTNSIIIGAGHQLTVLGNVVMGVNATAGAPTNGGIGNMVISGAGSLVVTGNSFRVSALDSALSGGDRMLLDMSGLPAATINLGATGLFQVGDTQTNYAGDDTSTVLLASNTTIIAGNLKLGPGGRVPVGALFCPVQSLRLGGGTNILNVTVINLGSDSNCEGGSIVFNLPTGTLTIRGTDGVSRAALNIGAGTATAGGSVSNVFDVTGHNADLSLGMLTIGGQPRGGAVTNLFAFDTGTLNIVGLRIGDRTNVGSAPYTNTAASIVNIGGGTVTIGSSGVVMGINVSTAQYGINTAVLNITNGIVNITNGISMLTQSSTVSAVSSTVSISGGIVTLGSNIITGTSVAGGAARSATLNLTGGTLNMGGYAIGTNNAWIDNVNIQGGTLMNVSQINTATPYAIVKTNTAVLTLAGSNAYTGATVINNGTFVLAGYSTGFGALTVGGAAMNVTGGTGYYNNVTLNGGTVLNLPTGSLFRFTNTFMNGLGSTVALLGGVLTNSASTDVLTNFGTIYGTGILGMFLNNQQSGILEATGGVLELTMGFTNAVNYGLLEAFGTGSVLKIDQVFNNYGSIFVTNGGSVVIGGIINNTNLVLNNTTGTFGSLQNNGSIIVTNGGTLNVTGSTTNNGSITVDAGSSAQFDYTLTPYSTNIFLGTIRFAGDFVNQSVINTNNNFNGTFIFNGTSNPAVVKTQQFEVASLPVGTNLIATTNFFVGTFQVGDPTTGSNGYVQLVDNYDNGWTNVPLNQILATSNLIIALSSSVLDWNNRSGFTYNLSNSGTMLWTNAGNPAGVFLRLDVVNTFTNMGTMKIGNGTVLQLSNEFLNASTGILNLFSGGVLTNFAVGGVLTNSGTIYGDGLVAPALSNGVGSVVTANAGTLVLGGGIVNSVNYGALGTTNAGTLAINNATLTNTAGATIGLQGGTFTLTGGGASNVVNQGTISGFGTHAAVVDNQAGASIIATGGVLNLTGGFNNNAGAAINAGLLAAMGASAQLNIAQAFTNVGTISLGNGTLTAPSVNNAGSILGYGTFNAALNNTGGVTNNASGRTLTFIQPVNNNVGGAISALNNSSLAFNNALLNSGSITVQDQSTAAFAGAVTNAGTITVQNQSLLTFNAGLTNNGTLAYGPAVNPSTTIVNGSLTLGTGGIIAMGGLTNNTLVVQGNFVNNSTNNNSFNMASGVMTFGAAGSLATNTFEVAGRNLGTNFAGFNNNFAVGTLNMTNAIRFVDYVNNGGGGNSNEVLYVDVLHLFNGATMKLSALTIYVGLNFIYEDSNGVKTFSSGVINQANAASLGLLNATFDNGGEIVFVPEPSTYALMGLGLAGLAGWRRWRKKDGKRQA